MIEFLFKKAIVQKVFKGDYYLKIEKNPHYSTGGDKLVKSYDLGFSKLALRCRHTTVNVDKIMLLAGLQGFPDITKLSEMYLSTQQDMWRLHMNSMVPIEHGLAEIVNNTHLNAPYREILGYYGYTHRGGAPFKIGDRLFDESYEPAEEDYPDWQWAGWKEKFKKGWDEGDDFDRKMIYNEGVKCVIPFKMRGPKDIETLEEAKQAAINMSDYLS